ncbi:serine hydrolase domain-containing protein [Marinifilum sp. D737]|uniref:serine hydrolase domain-containing protein n=1 Tax=Marinifilum sp. D737 TaxID=2969628 RepID=UPI002273B221|nr:serine hydrolase [Marinifilum sp. D737]MCY1634585.1 beta-lactamase family protein [Marinifilum sp. D737]
MVRIYLLSVALLLITSNLNAQVTNVQQSTPQTSIHNQNASTHYIDSIKSLVEQTNKAVCVLENKSDFIPVSNLNLNRIISISIDSTSKESAFQSMLKKYTQITCEQIKIDSLSTGTNNKNYTNNEILIVSIHNSNKDNAAFIDRYISSIKGNAKLIVTLFNTSHIALLNKKSSSVKSILYSNTNTEMVQETAAQIIFGGISSTGTLNKNLGMYPKNTGIKTKGEIRFQYTYPEIAGIDSETLYKTIDSVAKIGLQAQAFPGCQVLVAKDRKVIYHECFGYHTYNKFLPVLPDDIYDLASVTKITGPLPAIMRFVDGGQIDMDEKFSTYWKAFKRTNKKDIIFRDVLAHQAQLIPWIAFWKNTVDSSNRFKKRTYSYRQSKKYPVEVAPQMFLHKNYRKKIYKAIKESDLLPEKHYQYSGLSFYVFPKMIEDLSGKAYDDYIKDEFYKPLGAFTLDFNAYKRFSEKKIIPTENDKVFRNTLLTGYVDDEGCAMMGGISGNAGLFSSANDLAKMIQMYVQMGEYGGHRFISEKTMKEFTKTQFPENDNRRGLGFDKPLFGNDTLSIKDCYPAYGASSDSFGHSGFTGTFVWADPEKQLVYIFLSNRVHPSRESREIYRKNIRTAIHQGIYDAIEVFKEKQSSSPRHSLTDDITIN